MDAQIGRPSIEIPQLDARIPSSDRVFLHHDSWTFEHANPCPAIAGNSVALDHPKAWVDLSPDARALPRCGLTLIVLHHIATHGIVGILPVEPEPRPHVVFAAIIFNQQPIGFQKLSYSAIGRIVRPRAIDAANVIVTDDDVLATRRNDRVPDQVFER